MIATTRIAAAAQIVSLYSYSPRGASLHRHLIHGFLGLTRVFTPNDMSIGSSVFARRAGFKCVEALGRIIIRGPYPPSNAIIYNILWRPSLPCPPLNPALFARLTVVSRDQ